MCCIALKHELSLHCALTQTTQHILVFLVKISITAKTLTCLLNG